MSRSLSFSCFAWSRAKLKADAGLPDAPRYLKHVIAMASLPDTELAKAHQSLATIHFQQGHYQDARRAVRTAIRLQPDCLEFSMLLARAWEEDPFGSDQHAARYYRKVTLLDPTHAIAWASLARSAFRTGRTQLADKALRRALKLGLSDVRVVSIVVDALRESGRLKTALAITTRAQFQNPHSLALADQVNRIRYEIARRKQRISKGQHCSDHLLPFVRIVGTDGERRVIRRDEGETPRPISLRMPG